MRIEPMEAIAREMVGDGQIPNVFFVSEFSNVDGPGLVMVTRDFNAAYTFWQSLPRTCETSLEDRLVGVLCSTEPIEDGSKILRTIDDSRMLKDLWS